MRPHDRAKFEGRFGLELRAWKIEMMKAMHDAASNSNPMYVNKIHPINGLRVIRFFEKSNPGVEFDPYNKRHREKVHDCRHFQAAMNYHNGMARLYGDTAKRLDELSDA